MELRTLNDWVVMPRLRRIAGVADVINFGGLRQAVHAADRAVSARTLRTDVRRRDSGRRNQQRQRRRQRAAARRNVVRHPRQRRVSNDRRHRLDGDQHQRRHAGLRARRGHACELDSMLPTGIFSKDDVDEAVEGIVHAAARREPLARARSRQGRGRGAQRARAAQGRANRAVLRSHVPGRQHAAHGQPQHSRWASRWSCWCC